MLGHRPTPLGLFGMLILFAFTSCGSSDTVPSGVSEAIPQFELKKNQIEGIEATDYEILEVKDEGGVIRIDVSLNEATSEGETKRRTLNILHQVQAMVGTDDRLAVWAFLPEKQESVGMAFYSPLTETYHFKSADELN